MFTKLVVASTALPSWKLQPSTAPFGTRPPTAEVPLDIRNSTAATNTTATILSTSSSTLPSSPPLLFLS